jgi:hypothetical protein
MTHAPIWWYLWLGVVLLFGLKSILRRRGGRRTHVPERRARPRTSGYLPCPLNAVARAERSGTLRRG